MANSMNQSLIIKSKEFAAFLKEELETDLIQHYTNRQGYTTFEFDNSEDGDYEYGSEEWYSFQSYIYNDSIRIDYDNAECEQPAENILEKWISVIFFGDRDFLSYNEYEDYDDEDIKNYYVSFKEKLEQFYKNNGTLNMSLTSHVELPYDCWYDTEILSIFMDEFRYMIDDPYQYKYYVSVKVCSEEFVKIIKEYCENNCENKGEYYAFEETDGYEHYAFKIEEDTVYSISRGFNSDIERFFYFLSTESKNVLNTANYFEITQWNCVEDEYDY